MDGAGRSLDLEAATDRIYEASVLPDCWPAVLDLLAEIAGAVGTILVAADFENLRVLNSPSLDGFVRDFAEGDWAKSSSRTPKLLGAEHAGFLLEEDVYTPEELEQDVMIRDFLRPRGFGWATATAFPMLTGETLIFSIERRYADGPVPRAAVRALDALRPHLGRSALLSARLQLERARATVETLALLGLPAGIVGRNGRLHTVNDMMQALIPRVVRDGRERVMLANAAADGLLARALATPLGRAPQSIPIPATEPDPAIVAHVIPVRGAVRDVFSNSSHVLALTPTLPSRVPTAALLQGLFDLTAAEARIVRGIATGATTDALAAIHHVTPLTVRSQIKSVFAKTGVNSRVDLVRLVSGLSLAP